MGEQGTHLLGAVDVVIAQESDYVQAEAYADRAIEADKYNPHGTHLAVASRCGT